jgi:hypothetical protein
LYKNPIRWFVSLVLCFTVIVTSISFYPQKVSAALGSEILDYDMYEINCALATSQGISTASVPAPIELGLFAKLFSNMTVGVQQLLQVVALGSLGTVGVATKLTLSSSQYNTIVSDPAWDTVLGRNVEGAHVVSVTNSVYSAGDLTGFPVIPDSINKGSFCLFKGFNGEIYFITALPANIIYGNFSVQLKTSNPSNIQTSGIYYKYISSAWVSQGSTYALNANDLIGFETSVVGLNLSLHTGGNTTATNLSNATANVIHNPATWDTTANKPVLLTSAQSATLNIPATQAELQAQPVADAVTQNATSAQPSDWSDANQHLDFTPFLNIIPYTKFPFCLPYDLLNAVTGLIAIPSAPTITIDLRSSFLLGGSLLILNLSQFDTLATIARWFEYLIFIVALVMFTRKFIIT